VRWAVRVLVAVPLLAVAAWWTLALSFAGPPPAWLATSLAAAYAVFTAVTLLFLRPRTSLALYAVTFAALWLWWGSLRPTNDKEWAADVARLPYGEVAGDRLTLHNVRDFDYRSEADFTPRYEDRTYDLSGLDGVDLFLSYWGSPYIAHTILSWSFADGQHLAISIETRKDKKQQYSAIEGFFKQYELCYVAADERDVVRLRTNFRGEDVYLYHLATPLDRARDILLDYLASMNRLVERPQFYNALTDNCTTTIRSHVQRVSNGGSPFDWRIFANGYADQMLYERGTVDDRIPFAELRARSRINEAAKAADGDPGFSQRIREGLPDPRAGAPAGRATRPG
jgi:Domain of unknown function (DUF4105)